jgi:uncharacterized cupin superfamily protein
VFHQRLLTRAMVGRRQSYGVRRNVPVLRGFDMLGPSSSDAPTLPRPKCDSREAPSADNARVEPLNIFSAKEHEGRIDVAHAAGSTETLMFIYDIQPGGSSSPYHYEYEEEWLLVVDGTVVVRTPGGEHTLERGDLVRFPPGPAGAHKVMNRTDSPARTLLFSSSRAPAVSVYPDSDKIGVFPDEENGLFFRRSTAVSWADGEEGWDKAG